MLQTKSFKFSDSEGVNELLKNYRLASGASIMVSNGEIIVPFEDGEPMTQNQKNVHYKAQINEAVEQQEVIAHSNGVVDAMIDDMQAKKKTAQADLAEAETAFATASNAPKKKKAQAEKTRQQHLISEYENQINENNKVKRSNSYEIQRLQTNIDLFQKAIV